MQFAAARLNRFCQRLAIFGVPLLRGTAHICHVLSGSCYLGIVLLLQILQKRRYLLTEARTNHKRGFASLLLCTVPKIAFGHTITQARAIKV